MQRPRRKPGGKLKEQGKKRSPVQGRKDEGKEEGRVSMNGK